MIGSEAKKRQTVKFVVILCAYQICMVNHKLNKCKTIGGNENEHFIGWLSRPMRWRTHRVSPKGVRS